MARITINKIAVRLEKNEHKHWRGIHVVIINPLDCRVERASIFDTYESNEAFDNFADIDIPENFIVVAACKDDCVKHLTEKGRQFFVDLGSKLINKLKYREGFVFIG